MRHIARRRRRVVIDRGRRDVIARRIGVVAGRAVPAAFDPVVVEDRFAATMIVAVLVAVAVMPVAGLGRRGKGGQRDHHGARDRQTMKKTPRESHGEDLPSE